MPIEAEPFALAHRRLNHCLCSLAAQPSQAFELRNHSWPSKLNQLPLPLELSNLSLLLPFNQVPAHTTMINKLPVPVKPSYCFSPFNDQSIASTHCVKLLSPAIRRSIKCHYPLSRAAFQSCHFELHQPSLLIELAAFYCPFKLNQVRPQFGLRHFFNSPC